MLLAAALPPMSQAAQILPTVVTDTTAVSPPKRVPNPIPLNEGLGGLDGPAATIAHPSSP